MVELAIRHGDAPARLKDIAQCQDIPLAYLRELMTSLAAAGLVRPIRGPRGGYLLTRPPSEISVLDVVEPLEGPPALVDCTDDPALCDRSASCAAPIMPCARRMTISSTHSSNSCIPKRWRRSVDWSPALRMS
mgnify:CR=1 FL=1